MITTHLTPLEEQVLKNLYMSAEGNGHDFGFVEDHGIDPKQARGVISSLIKKNLITLWEPIHNETGIWTQFTWKNKDSEQIHCMEDVLKS
jgi:ferric iron reductase protein FhuF